MEAPRTLTATQRAAGNRSVHKPRLVLTLVLLVVLVTTACSSPRSAGAITSNSPAVTKAMAAVSATATPSVSPPPNATRTPTPSFTPESGPPESAPLNPSPNPTSTTLACWGKGGRIETHRLSTDLSPLPWEFRVYLPPCYDWLADNNFPSLYLIHGSTFTDDQWDRIGADETADRLIAAGEIPPFLIVMPHDRISREPIRDPFGQAVTDHILPWVESNYRALPQREYRAIGGLSRGAAWAVHLGLTRWDLFGAIGAHSLYVFWTDAGRVGGWLGEIPPASLPRIYLDVGDRDYLIASAMWFENLLTDLDIPHEWYLFPGGHEEAYWQAHLEGYLRWYTRGWNTTALPGQSGTP